MSEREREREKREREKEREREGGRESSTCRAVRKLRNEAQRQRVRDLHSKRNGSTAVDKLFDPGLHGADDTS